MVDHITSWRARRLLQNDSSTMTFSQPSFIVLLTIIIILVVAIVIAGGILIYKTRCRRRFSEKFNKKKLKNDNSQFASSITPNSTLSYSIESSHGLLTHRTLQQNVSNVQSISSMIPPLVSSRLNQKSMVDAYLNDFDYTQPKTMAPKQLNSYLFVDLHSTSSETCPEQRLKPSMNENTTSGYDTSTGADDKSSRRWSKYRRRRMPTNQRQKRRPGLSVKRQGGPRFMMRERSLPNNLLNLPQLRQNRQVFNRKYNSHASNDSTTLATDSDLTSESFSSNKFNKKIRHFVSNNRLKPIEEEKPCVITSPYLTPIERPSYFFEKVSTSRGDESDLGIYDDMPHKWTNSAGNRDGIVYVDRSIIV